MRILLMLALISAAQLLHAAEPMGRIFFTPEQRAQLDAARAQKAVASQVRDDPLPETITYNGIVRRSDGKATVWINNKPLPDNELRSGSVLTGNIDRDGQVRLQTGQGAGAAQVRLKVGQSAELLSGRVDEPYAAPRTAPAPKAKPDAGGKTTASSSPEHANKPGAPEANRNPAIRP